MKPAPTSSDELGSLIDRVQNLETEIKGLNSDKSDIYKEAKGKGFNVPAMKAVVAYLRKDETERAEHQRVFELYLSHVLGTQYATRAPAITPSQSVLDRRITAASQSVSLPEELTAKA